MNKNILIIIIVIVIVVLAAAGFYYFKNRAAAPAISPGGSTETSNAPTPPSKEDSISAIQSELDKTNVNDLSQDFQSVDMDINSL